MLGLTFAVGRGERVWNGPGPGGSSKPEQTSSVDREGLSELGWVQVGTGSGGL